MKQLQITEPGRLCLSETELPKPGSGEALLRVLYVGICGADVASFTGNQPFTTYPRIPGHEFSAQIVSVPENSRGLSVGDLVTCNPYFNCGDCYSCRRGLVNCCTDNQTMGVQRDGAFREYITMPVERILPGRGLSAKQLALIEPFAIGYHALSRAEIKPTDRVLIVGAGPIGLFAAISAKLKGASVYVSDVLDGRLEMAARFGVDGTVNPRSGDLEDFTRRITAGNGFDVCVEACGLPETFLSCIEQAAFGANLILIGNGKKPVSFVHSVLLKKELNVFGSRNAYTKDFEALIEAVSSGRVDPLPMVSAEYALSDAQDAFRALTENDGSLSKVLVRIGE